MPVVRLCEVASCTSEDTAYPASNLLSRPQKKWLVEPGANVDRAEIVLTFEKAVPINSIDIGNHGSQFIEVQVEHSTRESGRFVALLPQCSLMSVTEAKQAVHENRVHMFGTDKLLAATAQGTWDRVKIICRRTVVSKSGQFGLNFITVTSKDSAVPTTDRLSTPNARATTVDAGMAGLLSKLRGSAPPSGKENESRGKPQMRCTSLMSNATSPLSTTTPGATNSSANRNHKQSRFTSPLSSKTPPAPKRIFNGDSDMFVEEVEIFFKDIRMEQMDPETTNVSDLRRKMEGQRGLALSGEQRVVFMDVTAKHFRTIAERKAANQMKMLQSSKPNKVPIQMKEQSTKVVEKSPFHGKKGESPATARNVTSKQNVPSMFKGKSPVAAVKIPAKPKVPAKIKVPVERKTPSTKRTYARDSDVSSVSSDSSDEPKMTIPRSNGATPTSKRVRRDNLCVDRGGRDQCTGERDEKMGSSANRLDRVVTIVDDECADNTSKVAQWMHAKTTPRTIPVNVDKFVKSAEGKSLFYENKHDSRAVKSSVVSTADTQNCPICFINIPKQNIGVHVAVCNGRPTNQKAFSSNNQVAASNVDSLTECPICGDFIAKTIADSHVNSCLDGNGW